MKIACLRIVLRHVPVLQLHVHVQAQVMIRLETIFREIIPKLQQNNITITTNKTIRPISWNSSLVKSFFNE